MTTLKNKTEGKQQLTYKLAGTWEIQAAHWEQVWAEEMALWLAVHSAEHWAVHWVACSGGGSAQRWVVRWARTMAVQTAEQSDVSMADPMVDLMAY